MAKKSSDGSPSGAVQQAFKFALDPTPSQVRQFYSHCGASRKAYNWAVAAYPVLMELRKQDKEAGRPYSVSLSNHYDMCKLWTEFKKDPANNMGWTSENSSSTYQGAIRDAHTAWKNFWDSRSGQRKGSRVGRPRFKSKRKSRYSFYMNGSTLRVEDAHHVRLPKIGVVKTHEPTRKLLRQVNKGRVKISAATISRTGNQWFISFTVDVQRPIRTKPSARQQDGGLVGVDLGVKVLATLSTGEVVPNPRHLDQAQRKLRRAQRTLSRRQYNTGEGRSSGRYKRAKDRVAKLHAEVAFLRMNATHQLTSRLIHEHSVVAVEDLNVKGMSASSKGTVESPGKRVKQKSGLNRAILDAGFGMIRRQLEYKAPWYGSKIHVVDRFYPSSKTCSSCGDVRDQLSLNERTFTCDGCGYVEDRDLNAAKNLAAQAVRELSGAKG